ncbi:MAG: hypothetical protein II008_19115 [Oscillospiraceae bacterium]|nr:hypothetical protein [Oscillospiraceae bacterium]
MSILIKGMKKPKGCRSCMYSRTDIRNVDWCVLTEEDLPCDCPLIKIHQHGRLIDADELIERAWRLRLDSRESIVKMINDAQTIIPAEESEP